VAKQSNELASKERTMAFRILSIDGGGIRGIIPGMILAEIERRSDRRVAHMFDLIAGTSTGWILALGLVVPGEAGGPKYAAEDLVGFYEREGPAIFSRPLKRKILTLGSLVDEKYSSEGLEQALGSCFGSVWLSEVICDVLVTAYDIELREPHFFKSDRARRRPERDFRLSDVARATSAAPTYFEPARVRSRAERDWAALVDGGVFANSPAACALVEAICDHGADPADVVFLSLGTGENARPILYEQARGWGLARWAQPVLSVVFDGVSDTVDYQVESILAHTPGKSHYLRIQGRLDDETDDMDDASETNIRMLKVLARQIVAQHDRAIDDILAKLV
jgi:patatin-like phospholipase/acyl hydrolase